MHKAINDGFLVDLKLEKGRITNPNNETHSYEAAIIADFFRQQLISSGKRLSFETVMSHSSKLTTLNFATQNGFKNYLYFVCTESADINVNRVAQRVLKGGHPVAENKIRKRYYQSLKLLREAVKLCHRAYLFDNSGTEKKYILRVDQGKTIEYQTQSIPQWVDKYLLLK